jgi:hypothetical protein
VRGNEDEGKSLQKFSRVQYAVRVECVFDEAVQRA